MTYFALKASVSYFPDAQSSNVVRFGVMEDWLLVLQNIIDQLHLTNSLEAERFKKMASN
jgi:hypothetical protein